MRRAMLLLCLPLLLTGCRLWTVLDESNVDEFFAPFDVEPIPGGGIVVTSCLIDGDWGGRGIMIVKPREPIESSFDCDGPPPSVSFGPDGWLYYSKNPDFGASNPTHRIERRNLDTGEVETVFTSTPTTLFIDTVVVAPDGRILFGQHDTVPDPQGDFGYRIREVTGPTTSTPVPGTLDLGRWEFAVDAEGTIYGAGWPALGEPGRQQVFAVDAAGTRTVIAGTGTAGFSGDGGPAVAAQLNAPRGVGVTTRGQVLIADSWNDRVRMIRTDGTIKTVAGGGANPTEGVMATNGVLESPTAVAPDTGIQFWVIDSDPGFGEVSYVGFEKTP